MTKAELVDEVAKNTGLTKLEADAVVDLVLGSIVEALNSGEKIELRGFGSFRLRQKNPRRGRNPKTGEAVNVPAKRIAYFKPGKEKELEEIINS
ncbi:MAG: integration host factor subunit beta [Acidobacteria bacterium]|nr:integration host factor subunit beta [Acidobacteriota bacterium]